MHEMTTRAEIIAWRKGERRRLIEARLGIEADIREHHAVRIADHLTQFIGELAGRIIGVYWPFRGEPDLRHWTKSIPARGGRIALPVVVEKAAPLAFRAWQPGDRLVPGIWHIPIPAADVVVTPDIVIAPVIGFDKSCFRLGYGGGFYDRTLAARSPRPIVIGIGYAQVAIPSIYPLAHDIPMDVVITEEAIISPC